MDRGMTHQWGGVAFPSLGDAMFMDGGMSVGVACSVQRYHMPLGFYFGPHLDDVRQGGVTCEGLQKYFTFFFQRKRSIWLQ